MQYGQRLEDLLRLTQMGALEPTSALDGLYALDAERKTERDARRAAALEAQQAQQDALMGLAGMAYESSAQGDPLSLLIQNPEFAAGAAQLGMRPRQVAKQTGYYGPGGQSTVGLPAEEAAKIVEAVVAKQAQGLDIGAIKADVHDVARAELGSMYSNVAVDIDALINKVYGG